MDPQVSSNLILNFDETFFFIHRKLKTSLRWAELYLIALLVPLPSPRSSAQFKASLLYWTLFFLLCEIFPALLAFLNTKLQHNRIQTSAWLSYLTLIFTRLECCLCVITFFQLRRYLKKILDSSLLCNILDRTTIAFIYICFCFW